MLGNLRLLIAQMPLPEGETNSKGSGVESFLTRPNIFSLPFWLSYLFYMRSDPRLTLSTIITFSPISCKIMREFLTTTLVKKSAGSRLLTDAPGGPGGPIQKSKIMAFSANDWCPVVHYFVQCWCSHSVVYWCTFIYKTWIHFPLSFLTMFARLGEAKTVRANFKLNFATFPKHFFPLNTYSTMLQQIKKNSAKQRGVTTDS